MPKHFLYLASCLALLSVSGCDSGGGDPPPPPPPPPSPVTVSFTSAVEVPVELDVQGERRSLTPGDSTTLTFPPGTTSITYTVSFPLELGTDECSSTPGEASWMVESAVAGSTAIEEAITVPADYFWLRVELGSEAAKLWDLRASYMDEKYPCYYSDISAEAGTYEVGYLPVGGLGSLRIRDALFDVSYYFIPGEDFDLTGQPQEEVLLVIP